MHLFLSFLRFHFLLSTISHAFLRSNLILGRASRLIIRTTSNSVQSTEFYYVTDENLNIQVLSIDPNETLKVLRNKATKKSVFNFLTDWITLFKTSANSDVEASPMIFIHGSFHGGWCFAEHFLPFFSSTESSNHACYSLSLRGTSATGHL